MFRVKTGTSLQVFPSLRGGAETGRKPVPLGRQAFTLVEVLASVAIFATVIISLMVARVRAQADHNIARRLLTATAYCKSMAGELRLGRLDEGTRVMPDSGGFVYSLRRQTRPDEEGPNLQRYELSVSPPGGDVTEAGLRVQLWIRPPAGREGAR